MARGSLRHYSSHGRRSGRLQWEPALSFLLFAILFNFVALYLTHRMLIATFEPFEAKEKPPDVLEFGLYEPDEIGEELGLPNDGDSERPDDKLEEGARDKSDDPTASSTNKPANKPRPDPSETPEPAGRPDAAGSGEDRGSGEDHSSSDDVQSGPSDDDLVSAPDGQLAGSGDAAGGNHGRPDPLANLGGGSSILDQTFGPPPQQDRMRDVDEGVDNVLDSKRHLYGSFFNRMRDRVIEHWDPNRAHNRVDPDGSRFGKDNRTTVLMVQLDGSGKLLKTVIVKKSGAPHLDAEAIRAMKAASPFPNPPSGLPDAQGHIEFLVGFTLDFSGVAQMFRMQR